jgi:peptidoglycan/LPS O-acetylase OafA/YrhL
MIRAMAAWAVMWGHVRALFFVKFSEVLHQSWHVKLLYFFTGFGHQAVIVFFVLSGFLISSTVFKSFAARRWSWRDYAANRSVRLYIVLIPGLLLGLLWDLAGGRIFASTGIYSHPLRFSASSIPQVNLTVGNFVGNLLFLQTILCSTFGSNGPLWSLANEFWYYLLFPLVFFAFIAFSNKAVSRGIFFTLLAVCIALFVGAHILVGFLIWLAGCVLVIFYSRLAIKTIAPLIAYALISFVIVCACLVAARMGRFGVMGTDLGLGIAFTLFLFAVLQLDGRAAHRDVARTFADFSYTLYVLHFPLALFLRAWLAPPQGWQPDAVHLFLGAIIGIVLLGFAWMVSWGTERKTRAVQEWLRRKIRRNSDVAMELGGT